jgi:hypothetical protein
LGRVGAELAWRLLMYIGRGYGAPTLTKGFKMIDADKVKQACQTATNHAAFTGMAYWIIGFTEFGLVYWDDKGKCHII